MADIVHRVGIKSTSPEDAYRALSTRDGLAGWWSTTVDGEETVGGVLKFRFEPMADGESIDMAVRELRPAERVRWEVVGGAKEWVGTTVSFDIKQEGDYTIVLFTHAGWAEPVEFMHHCSTKWGVFMLSLKSLLETGKGAPEPHDVKIDNWN